jgi:hypothetical protein
MIFGTSCLTTSVLQDRSKIPNIICTFLVALAGRQTLFVQKRLVSSTLLAKTLIILLRLRDVDAKLLHSRSEINWGRATMIPSCR